MTRDVKSEANYLVKRASEVNWEKLIPALGDQSPKAATLWGDRNGSTATGFLVKFVDGFSSPPHIHNVSYKGIVLSGLIHNDDPGAAKMWLPRGSFWTQPKGEAHITAAKGGLNIAYIEIEEGPYLVMPIKEAFDSGERPINVDVSNYVWHSLPQEGVLRPPRQVFLWGKLNKESLNGKLVELPSSFRGKVNVQSKSFKAVVIRGTIKHQVPTRNKYIGLEPGSYFSSEGKAIHIIACANEDGCLFYARTMGEFNVIRDNN